MWCKCLTIKVIMAEEFYGMRDLECGEPESDGVGKR